MNSANISSNLPVLKRLPAKGDGRDGDTRIVRDRGNVYIYHKIENDWVSVDFKSSSQKANESQTDDEVSQLDCRFTNAYKKKLDGIEKNAQVNTVLPTHIANFETTTELNLRDVANRARANHTGTQAISTIDNLQATLDTFALDSDLTNHVNNTSNPHNVTHVQVGLGNVDNVQQVPMSQKGVALGVATLDSNAKVPLSQISDVILGQVSYQGTWNASTNTPTLPAANTVKGDYYVVSTAGTQFTIPFEIGDWVISNGVEWQKVDNTDAVMSVFGRLGNIVALAADYASFYVRHDAGSQGLTVTQQGNARTNINAEQAFAKNTAFNKNFGSAADTVTQGNDSRLSNSREWTATTISQAEAEAGTATTRRAWTAQRVRQAIVALGYATQANLNAHTGNTSNPHSVTKSQVGLSAVPNVDTTNAYNISSGIIPLSRLKDVQYGLAVQEAFVQHNRFPNNTQDLNGILLSGIYGLTGSSHPNYPSTGSSFDPMLVMRSGSDVGVQVVFPRMSDTSSIQFRGWSSSGSVFTAWRRVWHSNDFSSSDITNWNNAHTHVSNTSNPHSVTKTQVGLSGIPNTNASTVNFLRGDGQWITPPNDNTTYTAGDGLGLTGTVFAVDSTVARRNASNIFTDIGVFRRSSSNLALEEAGNGNKAWRHEIIGGEYRIVESGVRLQVQIEPGTGDFRVTDAIRADGGYKIGTTTVIDSSQNFFGADGTFSGTLTADSLSISSGFRTQKVTMRAPNAPQIILLGKTTDTNRRIVGSFVGSRSSASSGLGVVQVDINFYLSSNSTARFNADIKSSLAWGTVARPVTLTYNAENWYGIQFGEGASFNYPDSMWFQGENNAGEFTVINTTDASSISEFYSSQGDVRMFQGTVHISGNITGANLNVSAWDTVVTQAVRTSGTQTIFGRFQVEAGSGLPSTTFSTTLANSTAYFKRTGSGTRILFGVESFNRGWIQTQHDNNSAYNLLLNPIGGNVGIGITANPAEKLEVAGSIRSTQLQVRAVALGNTILTAGDGSLGSIIYTISRETGNIITHTPYSGGGFLFGGNTTISGTAHIGNTFTVGPVGGNNAVLLSWSSTDSGTFRLYSGGGSPTVSVLANGVSYFNGGNIGIGTTSPARSLHVRGDNGVRITRTGSFGAYLELERDGGNTWSVHGGVGTADDSFAIRDGSINVFRIMQGNTVERIRVDGSGNVGLSIVPTERLHVSGNVLATGTVTASGGNSGQWNEAYTERGSQIAGTGLSWNGNLNLTNTGVSATTYGVASNVQYPVITVDAQGRITSASTTTIRAASVGTSGIVTTTTQSFLGNKTFEGTLTVVVNNSASAATIRQNNSGSGANIVTFMRAAAVVSRVANNGDIYAPNWHHTSDERFKANIKPLVDGLTAIRRLEPIQYIKGGKFESGFSAQRTLGIIPEAVCTQDPDRFSMTITNIVAYNTRAIQQIDNEVETLKKEIAVLQTKLTQLTQQRGVN